MNNNIITILNKKKNIFQKSSNPDPRFSGLGLGSKRLQSQVLTPVLDSSNLTQSNSHARAFLEE